MIRVLQINAGSQVFGGVSSLCLNIYRNIDRSKVQFDFLTPNITTYGQYRDEIEEMGGRIIQLDTDSSNLWGKIKLQHRLKKYLKQNKYDVIHINSGVLLFNYMVAVACKSSSNALVIVHSHSNGGRSKIKDRLSFILKEAVIKVSDIYLACSNSAAEYMFPKRIVDRVKIIKNGIDPQKYSFSIELRNYMRKKYGVENKFVIGHVGRFCKEKNQLFLVNLLSNVIKSKDNAVLLLIGDGEMLPEVKKTVQLAGLDDKVLFLGAQKDVQLFYQMMDVFVLPSIFEGFGIVNLEAQASGLKCVVTDMVPKDIDVTNNIVHLSLYDAIDKWVGEILKISHRRESAAEQITKNGYDIRQSAVQLERIYCED